MLLDSFYIFFKSQNYDKILYKHKAAVVRSKVFFQLFLFFRSFLFKNSKNYVKYSKTVVGNYFSLYKLMKTFSLLMSYFSLVVDTNIELSDHEKMLVSKVKQKREKKNPSVNIGTIYVGTELKPSNKLTNILVGLVVHCMLRCHEAMFQCSSTHPSPTAYLRSGRGDSSSFGGS